MRFRFWWKYTCSAFRRYLLRYICIGFVAGLLVTGFILPIFARANSVERATQLVQQGKEFYSRSQFKLAATQWQQAVEIYRQQNDKLHQVQALTYLSLARQKLEQWSAANKAIATSLQLLDNLELNSFDSRLILAQTLNAKGTVLLALGKSEPAFAAWQQATQIYEQLGDTTGVTGSLINQAQALENLGFYRRTCKTLLKAANNDYSCDFSDPNDWKVVLQSFARLENNRLKILGLRNLGDILRQLGDWQHSEQVFNRSLQLEQSPQEKSITLLDLGQLNRAKYRQARNLYARTYLSSIRQEAQQKAFDAATSALNNYRQGIEIASNSGAKDIATQGQLNQLSLLVDLRQWNDRDQKIKDIDSKIEAIINKSIGSLAHRPPSHFVIQAQLNFAQSLLEIESKQHFAIQYLEHVQAQARRLSDFRAESYAWGILGHYWLKRQNWSKAQKFSQLALNTSQTINATELNAQWRAQLGRIYRVQGKIELAIAVYQDAVNDFNILHQDLATVDSDLVFFWQQDTETTYRNLVELFLTNVTESSRPQANLDRAIELIDSLKIREVEDFLNCNLAAKVSLKEQELDPTAALIYPIILENRLEIIVRLPQTPQLQHYSIPVLRSELERTLVQWRTELERRFISPQSIILSQKIYGWLIEPLAEVLEQAEVKTLVFVLDGGLRNLPMAALYDGREYLLERYAIAAVPGLKLLPPQAKRNKLNVLAFGLAETRSGFPPHQGFEDLDNVKIELAKISDRVTAKQYLNREFTSDNLERQIDPDFPILHLATHGQLSSESANTFLLAWDKRIDLNNLSSILQQSRSGAIELLVLSACQTAAGDNQATVGLAGIAIESGANSTLASLWNVRDSSTAQLMSWFYQELSQNKSKAEALRLAQVKLLHTPGYQAPFNWSPYVLLGNWL